MRENKTHFVSQWCCSIESVCHFFFAWFPFTMCNHETDGCRIVAKFHSKRHFHGRMWSYCIIFHAILFHSLICCPHLSCRSRLCRISRIRFDSVFYAFSFRLFLHVNFAFHVLRFAWFGSICSVLSLASFFFLLSCSLDFHKGTIIDSKPSIDGIEKHLLQKKNNTNAVAVAYRMVKFVQISMTTAKNSHYIISSKFHEKTVSHYIRWAS